MVGVGIYSFQVIFELGLRGIGCMDDMWRCGRWVEQWIRDDLVAL